MANGKKRTKSHRSPDWRPKAKPQQTRAEERVEKIRNFPVWAAAYLAANLGLLLMGGVISAALAVGACALDLWIVKREIPTAHKVLYCTLIFLASWVLWFVLMLAYQTAFSA